MGGTWRGLLHPSRIGARRLAGRSPAAWHTVRLQREVPGGDGVLRAGGRNLSPPPNTPAHTALSNLAASPTCPAVLHITDWPDRVSQLLAPGLISCPFGESFFFFFYMEVIHVHWRIQKARMSKWRAAPCVKQALEL